METAAKEPLPENFGKALRPLLSSDGPLLAALGQIRRKAQEMAWSLQAESLVSEEGVKEAVRKQGVINGLMLAIEAIIEPVKALEEENENEKLAS